VPQRITLPDTGDSSKVDDLDRKTNQPTILDKHEAKQRP